MKQAGIELLILAAGSTLVGAVTFSFLKADCSLNEECPVPDLSDQIVYSVITDGVAFVTEALIWSVFRCWPGNTNKNGPQTPVSSNSHSIVHSSNTSENNSSEDEPLLIGTQKSNIP